MIGWVTPQEASRRTFNFFKDRGVNSWHLDRSNKRFFSRFGFAEVRVQTKADGTPDFDRVVVGEAPNINAVCWYRKGGIIYIAVVIQARPLADKPDGTPADPPIIFAQPCVMGFKEKILGTNLAAAFESDDDAVRREALQEAGARGIKNITFLGYHNPNPTFCATWSEVWDVEVDPKMISDQLDATELIFRAEYIPALLVLARIGTDVHDGVSYRAATPNDAFTIWLARHMPEVLYQMS
ncbi:MAG: hypothetical protein AAB478_02190 [Patescibacteria group bacterium]